MAGRCLMVQGTASGVGKSLLTAALCRLFARRGYRVAPFKSQNMALNSAATPDGLEIGRAQAAQAEAAGIEPTVDMNPILLKPEADDRSQLVIRGVSAGSMTFREYGAMGPRLLELVEESLERLRRAYDLVLIEGAGSPAEINLAAGELVNMRIARLAEAPVLLVGDIDRGGVFAAFVGTLALLDPADRARIGGFVVNRFRGDARVLAPGLEALVARTGVPVLGVVPWLDPLLVPAEDSLDLEGLTRGGGAGALGVAVAHLPRIANFDDFEPLAREPGVRVRFTRHPAELEAADLVVLPGSKSTVADLSWLRVTGLAEAVAAAAARGTPVIGICGGYQMLGRRLDDPGHVDSPIGTADGLGLLPGVTAFAATKTTVRVRARVNPVPGPFARAAGHEITAYEIHTGTTEVAGAARPFTLVARGGAGAGDPDGAVSPDGAVVGTYLHGLFASGVVRRALLEHVAALKGLAVDPRWGAADDGSSRYDRLADAVGPALDLDAVAKLAGL